MAEVLDSGGLRVLGYLLGAVAAAAAGFRERRRIAHTGENLWPTFWFLTASLLAAMGVARWLDLAGVLTELGRSQARDEGWYEIRRGIQAMVIGGIAAFWALSVVVAIWRVPARRRYLPAAIVVFTLVCFAVARAISLHHIDALLDRRVADVRLRAVTELGIQVVFVVTTVWFPFVRQPVPGVGVEPTRSRSSRGA